VPRREGRGAGQIPTLPLCPALGTRAPSTELRVTEEEEEQGTPLHREGKKIGKIKRAKLVLFG